MPGEHDKDMAKDYDFKTGKPRRLYAAAAVVILAVAFFGVGAGVKLPITAAVTYKIQEPYDVQEPYITQECTTTTAPATERRCTSQDFSYDITNDRVAKTADPDSPTGRTCYGMFTISNREPKTGVWTYEYTFTGDRVVTKTGSIQILPNHQGTVELSYECGRDEAVTGSYTLQAPQEQTCPDVTVNREQKTCTDVEKTRTVTKYRDALRQRTEVQYKTPFEAWFGG